MAGTLRKAYSALKDTTTVNLAKVNSDFKDVDVAVVKATNHVVCPPKERHIRKILAIRARDDVVYCINALSRRLNKTHNWTVALKTLIVIHRTLRDGDPTFHAEFLHLSKRGSILKLSNFKDESSPIAWDCSAWVRTYALFLEERLECFSILQYDIEAVRVPKPSQRLEKGYSRTRDLDDEELLEQLPALQKLLHCLIGCRPEGAALGNYVIQYALAMVLKESFKIYCAINDGIISLVDKFFDMPRHEAVKALEIYRRASQQAGGLSDFYEVCRGLELARNFQFPVLREPPQSFLETMEEYVREAPRVVSVSREPLDLPERLLLTYNPEEFASTSDLKEPSIDEPIPPPSHEVPLSNMELAPSDNNLDIGDLLGLDAAENLDASAIEENNALALALILSDASSTYNSSKVEGKDLDPTGWELALVTTPSNNISPVNENQLAGQIDSLTLNSLYEEPSYRAAQQPIYETPAPNPFETQDPFAVSNATLPLSSVQMAAFTEQQSNPYASYLPNYQEQPQPTTMDPSNPFAATDMEPFAAGTASHSQSTNPFGSTGLL